MLAIRAVLQKAVQDRAPEAYRQLKSSGQLESTLDGLVAEYQQSLESAMGMATDALSRQDSPTFEPDPIKRAQQFATRESTARETALAQAIEQIDALSAITATPPVS